MQQQKNVNMHWCWINHWVAKSFWFFRYSTVGLPLTIGGPVPLFSALLSLDLQRKALLLPQLKCPGLYDGLCVISRREPSGKQRRKTAMSRSAVRIEWYTYKSVYKALCRDAAMQFSSVQEQRVIRLVSACQHMSTHADHSKSLFDYLIGSISLCTSVGTLC